MGELSEFQVGQTVELQDGRIAKVRFVGETQFSTGDWIGIELSDNTGKNDGAVQGQRYFQCELGHGMFLRPVAVTVVERSFAREIGTPHGQPNKSLTTGRPESAVVESLRRQSVLEPILGKRQSMNGGSPTPGIKSAVASRISRSPSKSPTKQLSSTTSVGNGSLPSKTSSMASKPTTVKSKPRDSTASRQSMGPPSAAPSRTSRQSIAGTLNGSLKGLARPSTSALKAPNNRASMQLNATKRLSTISARSQGSGSGGLESPAGIQEHEALSPLSDTLENKSDAVLSPASSHISTASYADRPIIATPSYSRAIASSNASTREIEDLKTRLSMMEKKRFEDREKFKMLDKIQNERDKFEGIILKLEGKLQPQQQEINSLKKHLREAEAKLDMIETEQADNDTAFEMATLDREMAEETAESFKTELDMLRRRTEELELDVEILREENAELSKEMNPEEKTSQGWLQMERSNERLREALFRLRDVTQQQESDLKQQIQELERDLRDHRNVKEQYHQAKVMIAQSEAIIEDLRQQLDTALGAEEMIEELTEKNLKLAEELDDSRAVIEDLESLKELNDELEIGHLENEKQMQDEIDYKESQLADRLRHSEKQKETIGDLEYTVARFRELVTNLQSGLEDMRASQQITEIEANELTARSKAMMDLNMRLQVSASKAQVKAIDHELRRMEAQESAEHLTIVQLFLPDTYNNERDSILALLRFKRVGFKANILHGFLKERENGQVSQDHEEDVFAGCEVLDELAWIKAMCNRFVSFIQSCPVEAFGKLEGALYDLEPVERAIDHWISALKKDELKEQQCAAELQRSIALMTHLAEVHIIDGFEQFADDVQMRSLIMQSNLDNAAIAMSHVKSIAERKMSLFGNVDDEEAAQQLQELFQKVEILISQIRSAKVICNKAIHQLEELRSRSLTLDPSTLPFIDQSQRATTELALVTRNVGLSLLELLNQEGRTAPFNHSEIVQALYPNDSAPFSTLTSKIYSTTTHIQNFYSLTTTLSQTTEFLSPTPPPPWQILAKSLRAATSLSASHESEVGRLKDELIERNTAIALKDGIVEEMSVKVEVLEKRVSESGGRRERVRELEGVIEVARSREKEVARKISRFQQDLQSLEAERENWKKQAARSGAQSDAYTTSQAPLQSVLNPAMAQREIDQLKAEIANLQATVRYLRFSTHQSSLSSAYSFLSSPLVTMHDPPTQSTNLAHESRGLLKEMLSLVTRPENQIVQLELRKKQDRLKWRPARESLQWQLGRQREEWEAWKEWRKDIANRSKALRKEVERKKGVQGREKEVQVLARAAFNLPRLDYGMKMQQSADVRILNAGEWEEFERGWGIA